MTDYLFQEVPVYDRLGVNLMLARNQRIDVLDTQLEVTSPGLKQNGQPVPYVTTDQLGRATFTTTTGFARLRSPRGFEHVVYSPEYLRANIDAQATAEAAAAAAASSAAAAAAAASGSNVSLDTDGIPYYDPGAGAAVIAADTDGTPYII